MADENRVKETTTTTGTGNLTLAGAVTNFVSFNTAYGTNYPFEYAIIDSANNVWEAGRGYLSASTTLVREDVYSNSSGTTTQLNLSAGTKSVIVSPASGAHQKCYRSVSTTQSDIIGPSNWNGSRGTMSDMVADRIYYVPHEYTYSGNVGSLSVEVTTAAASSKARIGIYTMGADAEPDVLLVESADIDTSTTGIKKMTITSTGFIGGWYYLGFICTDAAIRLRSHTPVDGLTGSPLGFLNTGIEPISHCYHSVTPGWTALPSTASAISTTDSWRSIPAINIYAS